MAKRRRSKGSRSSKVTLRHAFYASSLKLITEMKLYGVPSKDSADEWDGIVAKAEAVVPRIELDRILSTAELDAREVFAAIIADPSVRIEISAMNYRLVKVKEPGEKPRATGARDGFRGHRTRRNSRDIATRA